MKAAKNAEGVKMKKNEEKKFVSLSAKILAGALCAMLVFGSVAGVLFYIFA